MARADVYNYFCGTKAPDERTAADVAVLMARTGELRALASRPPAVHHELCRHMIYRRAPADTGMPQHAPARTGMRRHGHACAIEEHAPARPA